VVIGAGMGGLAAAACLGAVGRRVLVLEQHSVPGGFTQSFRRRGWSWDVGLHVVGEMGPASLAGRVLRALTGARLGWRRIPDPYDVVELEDGRRIELPGSLARLRESLSRAFPGEEAAIRRYVERVRVAASAMRDSFVMRRVASSEARSLALARTADVLAELTPDADLRAILSIQWPFHGAPPDRSCFGLHSLLVRHYRHGAYYPVGGSMRIGLCLAAAIAGSGGWVRTRASVEQILVRRGTAQGVRLAGGEEILAPVVIGAAGALNTVRLLPEEERRREWAGSIEALAPSGGHFTLNLGLKGDVRAAGASETSRWLLNGPLRDASTPWDTRSARPSLYVSFPSLKDGEDHGPEGLHSAELVAVTDWALFERWEGSRWHRRGPDYERLKEEISERMLVTFRERLPRLAELVVYREASTPLSAIHFVRAVRGASYGLEGTRERFLNPWLKPKTPVRGLYLAGSDAAVTGMVGALAGGLAAAMAIDPRQAGPWLRTAARRSG
jgi:all-trans-retinol 13,14-reductase